IAFDAAGCDKFRFGGKSTFWSCLLNGAAQPVVITEVGMRKNRVEASIGIGSAHQPVEFSGASAFTRALTPAVAILKGQGAGHVIGFFLGYTQRGKQS